jgi:hypothetical protein
MFSLTPIRHRLVAGAALAALALGVAGGLVGGPADPAYAAPKVIPGRSPDGNCYVQDSETGEFTIYLPGEWVTVEENGRYVVYTCMGGDWVSIFGVAEIVQLPTSTPFPTRSIGQLAVPFDAAPLFQAPAATPTPTRLIQQAPLRPINRR